MSLKNDDAPPSPLIDPILLKDLTEEQRQEALAAAAAAKRAEERAEQRALARALERKRLERLEEEERDKERKRKFLQQLKFEKDHAVLPHNFQGRNNGRGNGEEIRNEGSLMTEGGQTQVVFLSKKQREQIKNGNDSTMSLVDSVSSRESNGRDYDTSRWMSSLENGGTLSTDSNLKYRSNITTTSSQTEPSQSQHQLTAAELNAIKKAYLGETALQDEETARLRQMEEQKRARQKKKITFKFKWDDTEDTTNDGILDALPTLEMGAGLRKKPTRRDNDDVNHQKSTGKEDVLNNVMTKPLKEMTKRDWRIVRENCDIAVRGGKAPPPLRTFRESSSADVPAIHPALVDAIENVLKYKQPSPIQRQAIPIGLQRRDLIGVAETGSGKTAAFGIPLCHLILTLPEQVLHSVAENGPLALVMAPTRELAIQIDVEFKRLLSRQSNIKTSCIVGGQSIQHQAMELRNGVHIVVGTPGRINDCIENAYLVLNQCSYIVLDEADRMIDLGFAPQIESILESMGGLLKSEDEAEAYEQEVSDLNGIPFRVPKYRLTAMFSATMPAEVQRIAKKYLRHPAVVTIGGGDSGSKNKRIHQTVMFLSSPSMKEKALKDVILNKTRVSDKIIVFVNEKKNTEGVARIIERIGRRTVVLHGGKTQDQREENLEAFRRGGVILVATDVAGRGLDIPNVKHVINYDVPSRSIDSYCHRIGRTARAGAEGFATSFITDEDEGIIGPLKAYLESVGAHVPERLAKHPAASSSVGGNIIF